MEKGPNYERIRAMLNGNVSSEEDEERAWLWHYLELADGINRPSLPASRLESDREEGSQPEAEKTSRTNVLEFRKRDRDKAA